MKSHILNSLMQLKTNVKSNFEVSRKTTSIKEILKKLR